MRFLRGRCNDFEICQVSNPIRAQGTFPEHPLLSGGGVASSTNFPWMDIAVFLSALLLTHSGVPFTPFILPKGGPEPQNDRTRKSQAII